MLQNTRFKKKRQQIWKLSIGIVLKYSKIVLTVDMIIVLNCGLNFCILLFKIDITQHCLEDLYDPWYGPNFGTAKKLKTKYFQNKEN